MVRHRIHPPSNLNQFLIDIGKEVIAYRFSLDEKNMPQGFRRIMSRTRPLDAAHIWRLRYSRELSNIALIATRTLDAGRRPSS
jgi:hypothetical protein